MNPNYFAATVLLALFAATAVGAEEAKEVRPTIGRVENVAIDDADLVMKARIDTGAGLTSINAEVLQVKNNIQNKSERVVFQITGEDGTKKKMERTIVEWINIKKKSGSGFIRRPIVKLDFCLGGKRVEARANLADRTGFIYPLLVGRNFLMAGDYMIDPQQKFMSKPSCK